MNLTKYNNMSNEQIIALIEDCVADGLNRQEEICQHLQEMARRKQRHKFHKHPLYKWYNEVADHKLAMSVVALYSGRKAYLERLVGRSLDLQKSIIAERDIDVAQVDRKTGEIVETRKPVIKLNLTDFQRVFPLGKPPATVVAQRAALEAELAAKPAPAPVRTKHGPIVRADKARNVLKIGSQEVPLSVIKTALAEIGLSVSPMPLGSDELTLDLLG